MHSCSSPHRLQVHLTQPKPWMCGLRVESDILAHGVMIWLRPPTTLIIHNKHSDRVKTNLELLLTSVEYNLQYYIYAGRFNPLRFGGG